MTETTSRNNEMHEYLKLHPQGKTSEELYDYFDEWSASEVDETIDQLETNSVVAQIGNKWRCIKM